MAMYIYRSIDTSAPQISGTAGSLIGVLDACLVSGYGSKESMGQTKTHQDTNLATYRMKTGTSRCYLAVDDNGAQNSRLRGFITATATGVEITKGINPFPTDAQVSGGFYMYKSNQANTTTRPWVMISNGKIFYLYIDCVNDAGASTRFFAFGDISSYNPFDDNSCIIIGHSTTNYYNYFMSIGPINANITDHYLACKYDGMRFAVPCGKTAVSGAHGAWNTERSMSQVSMQGVMYPDPATGGLQLSPVVINESYATNLNVLRGRLPGVQAVCSPFPFITGDIVYGKAGTPLEGKIFEAFKSGSYALGHSGGVLIEISDTWDSPHYR